MYFELTTPILTFRFDKQNNIHFPVLATFRGHEDDLPTSFENIVNGSRISGGIDAAFGSHPHLVALIGGQSGRKLLCGGSLLTQRTVLTAAHCFDFVDIVAEDLRAIVGTNRWRLEGTSYGLMPQSVRHPNYVKFVYVYDVALVYTTSNVVFNDLVRPVTLSFEFISPGVPVKVAGWGRTSPNGDFSINLKELITTTIDGKECAVRWPKKTFYPHAEICTLHSTGHGFCYGDSGSPLTRVGNGQQIGIVSWMEPCAQGIPDVYTRISGLESWLQEHVVN